MTLGTGLESASVHEIVRVNPPYERIAPGYGILEASGERLDRAHIARWVTELDLLPLWERANAAVERR